MRIMAIDYGDAHTGIAISDQTATLAGYTTTLHTRRQEQVVEGIRALVQEYGVEELVLGYPKNMDGTLGPRAEKAEGLKAVLEAALGLPVVLWDERRTTIDATTSWLPQGKTPKNGKKPWDAVAAALILEGYLTFRKSKG